MAFRSSLRASQDVVFTLQEINKFYNIFQPFLSFWLFHQSGALICAMFCADTIVDTSHHAYANMQIQACHSKVSCQFHKKTNNNGHRNFGKKTLPNVRVYRKLQGCNETFENFWKFYLKLSILKNYDFS